VLDYIASILVFGSAFFIGFWYRSRGGQSILKLDKKDKYSLAMFPLAAGFIVTVFNIYLSWESIADLNLSVMLLCMTLALSFAKNYAQLLVSMLIGTFAAGTFSHIELDNSSPQSDQ
jgi:hypothetical protein